MGPRPDCPCLQEQFQGKKVTSSSLPGSRVGAQGLPGIGHGPFRQSWVTKCPSSAGLQAAQTMLGCAGPWPTKGQERLGDSTKRSLYPRNRQGLHSLGLVQATGAPDAWQRPRGGTDRSGGPAKKGEKELISLCTPGMLAWALRPTGK